MEPLRSQCQTAHDRLFSDTQLANQYCTHRFSPTRNLDQPLEFSMPPHDWIQQSAR
jgi:hypothetical protein